MKRKEYFDNKKNVLDYIKMADGYDGTELIQILKTYRKQGSTVLEIGMGPGKDLDILGKDFKVTGSDYSQVFLDLYQEYHPGSDLILLDAVTLSTNRRFDCIYSNKVLHHLTKQELKESILRQQDILNQDGVLFHSFWRGNKEEIMHGLRFVYYTEKQLIGLFHNFHLLEIGTFREMENDDSIYIILKKK